MKTVKPFSTLNMWKLAKKARTDNEKKEAEVFN